MQPKKPRLKRFWDIKRGLEKPSLFLPHSGKVLRYEEIDSEEFSNNVRKFAFYTAYSEYTTGISIHENINLRGDSIFKYISINGKRKLTNGTVSNIRTLKNINIYKNLLKSEMYDKSICQVGTLNLNNRDFPAIYFPVIYLSQVNSTNQNIKILDLYLYITSSGINAFRTTLDYNNKGFIHPHISDNFGSFCLGSSPLRMSLDVLNNAEDVTEDDVDIFWVNLYRTITQKTEAGAHYFDLEKLNGQLLQSYANFEETIFKNPQVFNSLLENLSIYASRERIDVLLNRANFIEENAAFFSENTNIKNVEVKNTFQFNGLPVYFNGEEIEHIYLKTIYASKVKLYSNLDDNINRFLLSYFKKENLDTFYDDYKKKLRDSDNIGAISTGENQVLQFQML